MPFRGLSFVAQAIDQAQEQLDTYTKQKRILAHKTDPQSQKLSPNAQRIAQELERQVLDNACARSGFACPSCEQEMVRLSSAGMELDYCLSCHNLWFDKGELKTILHQRKDIPSDHLRSRGSEYDCPHCNVPMREFVFLNPHNLLVDSCPQCHGILLEDDELERAFGLT